MLCAGFLVAVIASSCLPAVASAAPAQAVTVTRTLTVDDVSAGPIWLVDLASEGQEQSARAFALRWDLGGGWFPTWSLELMSDLGLVAQQGAQAGSHQVIRLAAGGPEVGHTYQASLSYSASLGALSVRVEDLTAQSTVYANTFSVEAFEGQLVSELGTVQPGYVPIGASWSVGILSDGSFLSVRIAGADDTELGVRLTTPPPYPPGTYRIWIEKDGEASLVASVTPQHSVSWVPLPAEKLPFGRFLVRVDYEEDGRVLQSDSVPLTWGRATLQLASITADRSTGAITGVFSLQGDSALPPLAAVVEASVVPLEWDPARARYVEAGPAVRVPLGTAVVDAGEEGAVLPFRGHIPSIDQHDTWRIEFNVSAEPDIALINDRTTHTVHIGPEPDLRVMTLNIRYPASSDGDNVWTNRRELTLRVIRQFAPDILGLQEPWDTQLAYLDRELAGYARIAFRPDRARNEHNAIYYNAARFELVDWGTFWLSETPDVPNSATWGNSIVRGVIWARLRLRDGGREVVVFNTHFHHTGDAEPMRTKSAELLLERVKTLAGGEPVIVMGDFNTTTTSRAYAILTGATSGLYDARAAAAVKIGPEGTTHGFTGLVGHNRIDWILLGGGLRVVEVEHIIAQEGNVYPSDHVPVGVTVYWQ